MSASANSPATNRGPAGLSRSSPLRHSATSSAPRNVLFMGTSSFHLPVLRKNVRWVNSNFRSEFAVPLEQAADGYARMMQGKARFRTVLVAKEGAANGAPLH